MVLSDNQNSEHFSGKLVRFWGLRPKPHWEISIPQTPSDLPPLPGQIPNSTGPV